MHSIGNHVSAPFLILLLLANIATLVTVNSCMMSPPLAYGEDMSEDFHVYADNAIYAGKPLYPQVSVIASGKTLVPGADYKTQYRNNVNAGTGRVTITGRGAFAGKKAATEFKISRADASQIFVTSIQDAYTWSGSAITPKPELRFGSKTLKEGRDYTISYRSNNRAGTAHVIISTKRNFTGTKSIRFLIKPASITYASIRKPSDRYTTSLSKVEPKPTVIYKGKKLIQGADYTITYKNNQFPGNASLIIRGKGNFKGSVTKKFKLVNLGDNLARAACNLSYSRGKWYQNGRNPGTKKYLSVYRRIGGNKVTHGRGCDASTGTIVRYSGYDASFPFSLARLRPYLGWNHTSHKATNTGRSSRWIPICKYTNGMERKKGTKIRAGDVVLRNGHICIYVGSTIPKEVYKKRLKGTDADKGIPTGDWVSAHFSHGSAAPGIGKANTWAYPGQSNDAGWVFRCVKPADKSLRAGKAVR